MPSSNTPTPHPVAGPLPPTVTITTWKRADASTCGKPTQHSWAELTSLYAKAGARVRAKADLAAPVFVSVRDECTSDNCKTAAENGRTLKRHRCDAAVVSIGALVYDHDHKEGQPDVPWDALETWCRSNGLACILYESPSHMAPHPEDGTIGVRWRIVLPLSESWTDAAAWGRAYTRFQLFLEAQTGIIFDRKTKNPSRIFYPPTRPTEDIPARRVIWVDGAGLDLAATLATMPETRAEPVDRGYAQADASSVSDLDDDDRVAFERWAQGAFDSAVRAVAQAGKGERNNTLNAQTFALVARFAANGLLSLAMVRRCMMEAAKQAGVGESEAGKTIDSACTGGRASPVSIRELIANWRKGRRERQRPVPRPEYDPETGEVTAAPPPSPADDEPEREPLQRLSDVLGDRAGPKLVMPPRYRLVLGARDECALMVEQRQRAKVKECPECHQVCALKDRECSQGHQLPADTADTVKQTRLAYAAVWVAAELERPPEDGNLLRLDAWVDGKARSVVVERALLHDARKLVQRVDGAGIGISTGKTAPYDFAGYLQEFQHVNRLWLPRKHARDGTGWCPSYRSFLLGREAIGSDADTLHLPNRDPRVEAIGCAGTAAEWRSVAERFIAESPAAALALAISVASPMLRLLGFQTCALILPGLGGLGKTAIERLAGSAFGSTGDASSRQASGLVGNGNATVLALPGQFMALRDLPHIADEVTVLASEQRARHEIARALHQLVDGEDRTRLKQNGDVKPSRASRGNIIIATEIDPADFLRLGGVTRRFLIARGPYSAEPQTKPLGRHVPALAQNHGHAGRALVEALVATTAEERAALAELKRAHAIALRKRLTTIQAESETIRTWTEQLAVALAAVDIACKLCPDAFPDHDGWLVQVLGAWNCMLLDCGTLTGTEDPVHKAYEYTLGWIAAHRANLQPSKERERVIVNRDGDRTSDLRRREWIGRVRDVIDEDGDQEQLQIVDVGQAALCSALSAQNYSAATLMPEWARRGWLVAPRDRERSSEWSIRCWLGGVRTRAYRVRVNGTNGPTDGTAARDGADDE